MPSLFSVRIHKPIEFTRRESAWAGRRSRRRCARFIDALARPESRSLQMLGPPLVDSATTRIVLPELLRVRPLLTDASVRLPRQEVERLAAFLMNGRASALFDRSPDEARQHAHGVVEGLLAGSRTVC
jgi:hypothetical protein